MGLLMKQDQVKIQNLESKIGGASFLVRIWWESREDPQDLPVWRGRVEHVPSGRIAYFDDVAGWQAFVERWTGKLISRHPGPKNKEKEGK